MLRVANRSRCYTVTRVRKRNLSESGARSVSARRGGARITEFNHKTWDLTATCMRIRFKLITALLKINRHTIKKANECSENR